MKFNYLNKDKSRVAKKSLNCKKGLIRSVSSFLHSRAKSYLSFKDINTTPLNSRYYTPLKGA